MDLATIASRFEGVRWNKTKDAFIVSCPNHPGTNAIVIAEGFDIVLKCPQGCRMVDPDIPKAPEVVSAATNGHVAALPQPTLQEWRKRMAQLQHDVIAQDPDFDKPQLERSWAVNELVQGSLMLISQGKHPEYALPAALTPEAAERELAFMAEAALEVRAEAARVVKSADPDEVMLWEQQGGAVTANDLYLRRVPIIERLAYSESISLLVGPKHGGKTTNVRTAAMAVMRGEPIWDRATTKGHVIYVASVDEVASTRMQLLQMGWTPNDPLLLAHQSPAAIAANPGVVLDQIARMALKCGTVLIVLDMLFDFAPIKDEMSYAGTRLAAQSIQHLADITKAHVMATHHSPKYMLDTATAATAALGSQGIAARFSPIILARKWGDELFTVESTMTRDPRGAEIPQTVVEVDEHGWARTAGIFKDWMKWKIYAKRILGHMEAGEPGQNFTVGTMAKDLEMARPHVQNALYQLFKRGDIDRIKTGRSYKYFLKSHPEQNEPSFGLTD